MKYKRAHSYTFIIRLWRERAEGESFLWRGSLDCIQGGERVYFQGLDGLFEAFNRIISILSVEKGEDLKDQND